MLTTSPEPQFSSLQIAQLSGATLRQLQWLDEHSIVSPRHEGHRRIYSFQEALEIQVIAELKRKGLSLHAIRKHLRYLRVELPSITTEFSSDLYFVVSGGLRLMEESGEAVIRRLAEAKSGGVVVDIGAIVRRITGAQARSVRQ